MSSMVFRFLLSTVMLCRLLVTSPDPRPVVVQTIPPIRVELGVYFQFSVPEQTFYDLQDGDTRNLTLSLLNSQFQVGHLKLINC